MVWSGIPAEIDLDTLIAIAFSVVFFVLSYRKTVGARKERARAANSELTRLLIGRIVQDSYDPEPEDLRAIIQGKALENSVKTKRLHTPLQLLCRVYAEISDTNLLKSEQREEVLSDLADRITEIQADEAAGSYFHGEAVASRVSRVLDKITGPTRVTVLLALLSSTIGGLSIIFLGETGQSEAFPINEVGMAVAGSLLGVFTVSLILRLREAEEETKPDRTPMSPRTLQRTMESRTEDMLEQAGARWRRGGSGEGFDYLAKKDGKNYAIEVKAWPTRPTKSHLRATVNRLTDIAESRSAEPVLVVAPVPAAEDVKDKVTEVTVVTVAGLRDEVLL